MLSGKAFPSTTFFNFANEYTYFKPVLTKASPPIKFTEAGITIEPFIEVQKMYLLLVDYQCYTL